MKFTLKAWIGIILLVINQPFGIGSMVICNAIAFHRHNALYTYIGIGAYVLSWVMLGLGILLAGPEGFKYARLLFKKLWNFLTRRFR